MPFTNDSHELAPGLVIFRRGDVKHQRWYCRARPPGADRYSTVSLRTADFDEAKRLAQAKLAESASPPRKGDAAKKPFLIDAQELKPGLILFRRGDVAHRRWYCRVRLPKADRYKVVSLKTSDIETAKERAYDEDAEIRFKLKHEVPVFNRTFSQVAKTFSDLQLDRVEAGQISRHRWVVVDSVIRTALEPYVGSTQITLVSQEHWSGYPLWRKKNGRGVHGRISDATIRNEMSIFRSVMVYAQGKKLVPESLKFGGKLPLAKVQREEFTAEEYRKLHTFARSWVKKARNGHDRWYRDMVYEVVLIMCNTGMRPSEAKNLRWRDVAIKTDSQGRRFVVLQVRGKGKFRSLVAAGNVADYIERVRAIAVATGADDHVFTTKQGAKLSHLYAKPLMTLLDESGLRKSSSGSVRSPYCFRHTYATFRLIEGVDVYFLAKQMGTSVKMIEDHYGHINPVKNADRILQGMPGWEPIATLKTEAGEQAA